MMVFAFTFACGLEWQRAIIRETLSKVKRNNYSKEEGHSESQAHFQNMMYIDHNRTFPLLCYIFFKKQKQKK